MVPLELIGAMCSPTVRGGALKDHIVLCGGGKGQDRPKKDCIVFEYSASTFVAKVTF